MRSQLHRSSGFTLVETLIVVGLMGIVAVALATAFTVIVRTQPSNETRTDDARTSLGLTTYLPEDVDSTPRLGFVLPSTRAAADAQGTGCVENTTAGFSLLKLTWTESIGSTDTYVANYRLLDDGDGTRIVRFHCKNGGSESTVNMTSLLPALPASWDPGELPFRFILVGADGVAAEVTTKSGETLSLDARSNNPAETLPPDPVVEYPPAPDDNSPPIAPDVNANTLVDTPVVVALGVSDPDIGDAVVLTPASPTVSAATAGWTASLSGQTYTVTPPIGASAGEVATFTYTATDPYGETDPGTVTVTLVAAPLNDPPQAEDIDGIVTVGTPLVIDLDDYASDPNSDPLTVSLSGVTDGLDVDVNPVTLIMTITSDGTVETPAPFTYTVDDGKGETDDGLVTIDVIVCEMYGATPLTPVTATRALHPSQKRLVSDVEYTVKFTGPCDDLILRFDHDGNGTFEFPSFGNIQTVGDHEEARLTVKGPGGLKDWTVGDHTMVLRNGVAGTDLATATLTTT